jgi:DNA-binding SARP family transcriptional activator/predicted ATPase
VSENNSSKLRIRLLGEFKIVADNKLIPGFNAERPQSLLAYLLLHLHAPQSRQHLAFLLWPDSTECQARTNLRNLLHSLRHLLPDPDAYLLADNKTVQWHPDASYDLDVAQFDKALQDAALADNYAAMKESLETAVSIYGGDLLPGNYDEWLIPVRQKTRQQYLDALGKLANVLEIMGDHRSAVRYSRQLWQQDTLDETTAVQLMRSLALSGDRAGVQRVYQVLTSSLHDELGLEPSPATREAYAKSLNSEPNPDAAFLRASLTEWRPRPLPIPVTPFIGREKELSDIAGLLADPGCRLLTVVGLCGMGKTRLVLQTALAQQAIFSDGVAFASLANIQSTRFQASTLAGALKLTLSPGEDDWTQINTFLGSKEMLLVVDNVDHLLSSGRENGLNDIQEKLFSLLQSAPRLKLLVTSRQRLDLIGEWVYEIQGLALPETAGAHELAGNSAVKLFLDSARRVDSEFASGLEDLQPILQICHLVDGSPLGIELAASWVRVLTCKEIAEEITRSIDFLGTELANVPEKHNSMRAIFDQSWDLLLPAEKQVLARLSNFGGVFSRDAAEREAGASLATLSGLVNKSLIHRVGAGQFKLHNLVRRYAALHLHKYEVNQPRTRRKNFQSRLPELDRMRQKVI